MNNVKKSLTFVKAEEGKGLSVVGDSYRVVIAGKQTEGRFAAIEMLVPPGGGPGPHAHAALQESFFVLEGEIEIKTEEGTYTAGQGTFVNIPLGGLIHSFKNKTDKVARLWCVVVPAGMEDFFEEAGTLSPFGNFVPPPPMDADGMKRLEKIAEKHGQKLFPPDYLD